jgi:DNA-binding NtrC family response regulator
MGLCFSNTLVNILKHKNNFDRQDKMSSKNSELFPPNSHKHRTRNSGMSPQKNILIVEDDPASQSILTRLLKTRGYSVCTASTGHQAMAVTAQKNPKLALVDVVLPEVSGLDFLKWLRANHPGVRVIMLSVLEEESTVAHEARALGVYDYFRKPPDFSDLLTRIDQAMF